MNVPILSQRRQATRRAIEDDAMSKALVAVGEAIDWSGVGKSTFSGSNAQLGNTGMRGAATLLSAQQGGSTPAGANMQNALIARVTQNLASGFQRAPEELEIAMAEQGLSWGPPFPPGRPLDPFWGVRRPARTWDYAVGENVQLTPRWDRINFQTLKSIYESYDVAQICVRHLINDVRSLEYAWGPMDGVREDVSDDIEQAVAFWEFPDKRQPFRAWLAEYLQDVLRYDAGALYIRRNNSDEPIALEVVSGETIIPLVDFFGRRPEDEDDEEETEGLFTGQDAPAYVQIIKGLPWDWLAADDLIYQPWNPMPESQYGLAPLEAVLLSANTDIRFQWHFLNFFTEGALPEGFMEAPPDQSDPAQIEHWQQVWDAIMVGDMTKKRQVRWVPSGSNFTETKPESSKFNEMFPLYLMRRTCASFGVTPADLGFTENVNKSSGDTQIDVQFRVGTAPLLRHCEDIINMFTRQHLKLRCRIKFDDGRETEDRVATAQAEGIYIDHGVISPDEPRERLGYPVDKSRPMPRFINNARSGPIPLLGLESMAGKIDPETHAPAAGQPLVDTPFYTAPGVLPPQGTPEQSAAGETTAQNARDLRASTTGTPSASQPPAVPDATASAEQAGADASGTAAPEPAAKTADNTGGPGVHPSTTVPPDEDEEEDDVIKDEYTQLALKRWRSNARNRLRKGQAPRKFIDPNLSTELHAQVWAALEKARTRGEVDKAFADVGKKASAGSRPAFHSQAPAIVAHYAPKIHAAIAKFFTAHQIDEAIKAAYDAAPLSTAQKAALWDKSDRELNLAELVYKAIPDSVAAARAAAAKVLTEKAANVAEALQVLETLYGDAFMQGAHDAAAAADASLTAGVHGVTGMPDSYWSDWKPGYGDAAARAADGGMREMLDQRDITIKGMADTSIDRIGNTIAEGLAGGDSYEATGKAVRDMIGEVNRSEMIANTEYARANTEASMSTYRELELERKEFLAEGDACIECQENEEAGSIPLEEEFPNGDVPVHPNCRCAVAPADVLPSDEGTTPGEATDALLEGAVGKDVDEVQAALDSGEIADTLAQHTDEEGKLSPDREALHDKIMHEFLDGHASQDSPEALFTAGGGASGKSSLINLLGVPEDAVKIDPDEVRKLLPEYLSLKARGRSDIAASATHEEASALSKEITAAALENKQNVIIDGVGNSGKGKFAGKIQQTLDAGYKAEVRYAHVPLSVADARNQARYKKTGRLVPTQKLHEQHANVSQAYNDVTKLPVKVNVYDTNSTPGKPPPLISSKAETGKLTVHSGAAHRAFKAKAKRR